MSHPNGERIPLGNDGYFYEKENFRFVHNSFDVFSLVPVQAAFAEDVWMSFYVGSSGSDSASGTQSTSFKTLQRPSCSK